MPSVHVIKVSRPSTQSTHAIQHPSVCIVAQGAKSVMIGEDVYGDEAAQVAVYRRSAVYGYFQQVIESAA